MTARRIPLLPTLLVLAAVGIMIRLGLWQLDRLHQKEALLAYYARGQANPAEVPFPTAMAGQALLYRHSRLTCSRVLATSDVAGRNAAGEAGLARMVRCETPGGTAMVTLGWARAPGPLVFSGGEVVGIIAPGGPEGVKLVADPPLGGLAANARPDPREIPNNHLSYAVQWFLFAATAVVIYALALRGRWRVAV
ncbi:MAG: SURF1 family protein [Proteobacteria bacterium]|nr:SURF1 family protein [Pseudomonadota bacterium]